MPKGPQGQPDPKELGRALYEVIDTITHDWTRGPIELQPDAKFQLVSLLRDARNEINELLSRLEAYNA